MEFIEVETSSGKVQFVCLSKLNFVALNFVDQIRDDIFRLKLFFRDGN